MITIPDLLRVSYSEITRTIKQIDPATSTVCAGGNKKGTKVARTLCLGTLTLVLFFVRYEVLHKLLVNLPRRFVRILLQAKKLLLHIVYFILQAFNLKNIQKQEDVLI